MSSGSTHQILKAESSKKDRDSSRLQQLVAKADEHYAHKQQCLYRACAGVTTFKVQDPDPNAANHGTILALRFDVMSNSRFMRPYYVMLSRPYRNSQHVQVHRHTVPYCIPLAALAARHLPPPTVKDSNGVPERQDVPKFVRALRRELVRFHNRAAVIGDLRSSAGLDGEKGKANEMEDPIVNISAADPQATQIRVEWSDGRTGRLVMSDDGDIVKMVVQGESGQYRETARQFVGGCLRIEEVTQLGLGEY